MGLLLSVGIFGTDTVSKKTDPRATVTRREKAMKELHGRDS